MSKEAAIPKKVSSPLQREKDETIVKVIFHNHESPGSNMNGFAKKYKGQRVKKYSFEDGKIYDVDKGYVNYVNKTCRVPVYEYRDDEHGRPTMSMTRYAQRYSFESLAFMDEDDMRELSNNSMSIAR